MEQELSFDVTKDVYEKADKEDLKFKSPPGLSRETVIQISKYKGEPEWML